MSTRTGAVGFNNPISKNLRFLYLIQLEKPMPTFTISALVGLGLVAGIALGAQAQTASGPTPGPSLATLPPAGEQGPRPSSYLSIRQGEHVAVTPSAAYIGPAPGAGTGAMPPHFERSAGWDADPTNKAYDAGKGPRAN